MSLLDIALAIMQFHGKRASEEHIQLFLIAYHQGNPLSQEEIAGVKYYIALHWAETAKFFAWRLAHNISANGDLDDNAQSLKEIRAELEQALSMI